jgi:hypothetical protein
VADHGCKISVLLKDEEATRFDAYCREKGFKKGSLIARLIREHLDRESFRTQHVLFADQPTQQQDG